MLAANAAFRLYCYYHISLHYPESNEVTLLWLRKAADLGNPFSEYELAYIYMNKQQYGSAQEWIDKVKSAPLDKDFQAMVNRLDEEIKRSATPSPTPYPDEPPMLKPAPNFYLTQSDIKDLESLSNSSDRTLAANAAYRLYLYYDINFPPSELPMPWLRKAADLGHQGAQYNLAYYYRCKRDYVTALKWIEKLKSGPPINEDLKGPVNELEVDVKGNIPPSLIPSPAPTPSPTASE
jgi:TPR repeat protein